jgi:hypothetical protein
MKRHDHRHPKIGDIVACKSDEDIGIVLRTYFDYERDLLMVEVAWNSLLHQPLTDPWRAKDFTTVDDMFHIMSRA